MKIDMPASVKDDEKAGTAEGNVCGVKYVSPVLNGDTSDVIAFRKMDNISSEATKRDFEGGGEMYQYETKEG
jgi:hypothetical protein